jgi:hypothetical protein
VAGHQVSDVLDSGDSAAGFDLHYTLFEQTLATTGADNRFSFCIE